MSSAAVVTGALRDIIPLLSGRILQRMHDNKTRLDKQKQLLVLFVAAPLLGT